MLHLLSNAVKYHKIGGTARGIGEAAAQADRLHLAISDAEDGLPAGDLEKLAGTGIGLALTKSLVEAMGGTIDAEGTPGSGSTFYLELPNAATVAFEAEPVAAPAIVETLPGVGPTVLYIEDNSSNFALVQLTLQAKRPDIRLLGAAMGSLGLEMAREHAPDLILLDLCLPDLSGEEVLLQLQASDRTKDIPVVMVSADASERQSRRLSRLGARAYVTKPLKISAFVQTVNETLANTACLPQAAAPDGLGAATP